MRSGEADVADVDVDVDDVDDVEVGVRRSDQHPGFRV